MHHIQVNTLMERLGQFQQECYQVAKDHGFWEKDPSDGSLDGEQIALMHSELSEALEAFRHGNPPDDKIPRFSGAEAELADCLIRILNFAEGRKLDVIGAMVAKNEFNKKRPHKHGGKKF